MLHSSHIHIDGASIHLVSGGQGRPLLFLHGFPEFWFAWRPQLAHFARSHRVIALDLPGCNLSDPLPTTADYQLDAIVQRIAALIRQVAPAERISVIGHDVGGVIAWELAARHPDLVDRLVAINAPPAFVLARQIERDPRQRAASAYRQQLATPGIESALAADGYAALAARLFDSTRAEVFPEADRRAYLAAWARPGALSGMLGYYRAWPEQVVAPARVEAPTLVIWGEDDPFLLAGCLEGIEAMAREVEVLRVPGASHWVAREQAAHVNAQIARFLAAPSDAIDFTRIVVDASGLDATDGDDRDHGRILGKPGDANGWPTPTIEPGRASVTLRFGAMQSGVFGIAHGGLIFTVLDELMAWLVVAHVGEPGVTASASIEYLAPLHVGDEYIFEATPEPGTESTQQRIALAGCVYPVGHPTRPAARMKAVFSVPTAAHIDAMRGAAANVVKGAPGTGHGPSLASQPNTAPTHAPVPHAPCPVPLSTWPVPRAPSPPQSSRLQVDVIEFGAEHIAASAALMARAFAAYDPLTRAAGISEAEMYPYSLDIAEKAVRDGFSLVGLDADGRVIACMICEGSEDFIVPTRPLCAKFDAVFALVDELHDPFLTQVRHQHPPGSIAHCTDLAVAVDMVGRGVANQMNLVNAVRLRERGYRYVYSEFSNAHNYRSLQDQQHRVLARIDFPSFEFQGRRPFSATSGCAIAAFGPLPEPALLKAQLDRCLATG